MTDRVRHEPTDETNRQVEVMQSLARNLEQHAQDLRSSRGATAGTAPDLETAATWLSGIGVKLKSQDREISRLKLALKLASGGELS